MVPENVVDDHPRSTGDSSTTRNSPTSTCAHEQTVDQGLTVPEHTTVPVLPAESITVNPQSMARPSWECRSAFQDLAG